MTACSTIEHDQTSCVLLPVVGKTCKQAVANARAVIAVEKTCLFSTRSFVILSEFLAA